MRAPFLSVLTRRVLKRIFFFRVTDFARAPAGRVRAANRRFPLCKVFPNPLEPHTRRERIVGSLCAKSSLFLSNRTACDAEQIVGFLCTKSFQILSNRTAMEKEFFPPSDEGRLPHSVREMSRSDRGRPPPSAGGFCRKAKDGGRDRAGRGTIRRFTLYETFTAPLE